MNVDVETMKRLIELGDRMADDRQARTLGVDPNAWDWHQITGAVRASAGMPEKRF